MDKPQPRKHRLSLEDTRLSKRWPSWLLFGLVLLAFLIVPLLSLINSETASMLRSSPLPSDNAWISGPLSAAHQIPELNKNCEACHANAFEVVQDQSCLECHNRTNQHLDIEAHDISQLDTIRCASCHREHNKPTQIVRKDDLLCSSCHRDMASSRAVITLLRDVDSFGLEQRKSSLIAPHPSFRVSMLAPTGKADASELASTRIDLDSRPAEISNLTFAHNTHLDPAGIDSPDGTKILACNDCHVPDGAGRLMQPISMENNCRSCHSMVFDPDFPDRVVPHGEPDTVLLTLEEFYSRQFLLKNLGRQPNNQELKEFMLRRPGRTVKRRAEQSFNLSTPWGKANSVAEEIFERTTCKTCHQVSIDQTGEHLSQWRVDPIRLTKQWLPKSTFDHFSHRTAECGLCHQANDSEQSSDVLIPDIQNCESCHTGLQTHESKVPTSCMTCHQFHLIH